MKTLCLEGFYKGKRVLVTGNTGFKGSWLSLWLSELGAQVFGWSLDVPTNPSLFRKLNLEELVTHHKGDVNNKKQLSNFIKQNHFDIIFHLAAQPLVRESYQNPLNTLITNVVGTANVLEAVRESGRRTTIICVTSDKCYENSGAPWGFRECDPVGGSDPYSMSKGAAELVISSWRSSFFTNNSGDIRLASVRAGNVIGGGDWATDRILTDCVRALSEGRAVEVRNPNSTRPWQHVLEPLSGYLWLAARMAQENTGSVLLDGAWNFGPHMADVRSVSSLVDEFVRQWGSGGWISVENNTAPKEATSAS